MILFFGGVAQVNIGVIAVQGDVSEHVDAAQKALRKSGFEGEVLAVRTTEALAHSDALIIPGGESTTISRLLEKFYMSETIKEKAGKGLPIMGTCAGLIMLAKEGDVEVEKTGTHLLGLMDMKVTRNAFGRQKESFEAPIDVEGLDRPYKAVFIRAPAIEAVWGECRVLARFQDNIVLARQNNLIAVAFHPELTEDMRIHEMFFDIVQERTSAP
jgi:5'-phosphate synthase pdxT subunit